MNIEYKDYVIEIIDETYYSLNSTDNTYNYEKIFIVGNETDYSTKYGIRIKNSEDEIIRDCLLVCGKGAGTSVCKETCVIDGETAFICISNVVVSLSLIGLQLNWYKEVDFATAFGIYKMNEDFIIHGEMSITRINKNGEIIWQQSGSDIFVLPMPRDSPVDNFHIDNNMIFVQSWDERKYCISYNGEIS